MLKKDSTIYDVAKSAGISIATVSRVLNNPDIVSTNPHLTFPSFIHRLKGITTIIDGTSFELSMITINNKDDIDQYLKSKELTHRLDGIIVLSMKLNRSTIDLLKKLRIKTVFIEFGEEGFSSISIDNIKGGEIVADFLIQKSYNSFAVLTHNDATDDEFPNSMRVKGFCNRLSQNGYQLDDNNILYSSNNLKDAISKSIDILSKKDRPEVIFATTDLLAVAVIKAAKRLNIKIPEELGIIGFDGTTTSEYMDITTVDQSLEISGKMAAELLLKKLKKPELATQTTFLPLKIVERDTTR